MSSDGKNGNGNGIDQKIGTAQTIDLLFSTIDKLAERIRTLEDSVHKIDKDVVDRDTLDHQFKEVNKKIEELNHQLHNSIDLQFKEMNESMRGLQEILQASKGFISVLKLTSMTAGLLAAISASIYKAHDWIKTFFS